jgi:hypothetical protein
MAAGQFLGNGNGDGMSLGKTAIEKISLYGVDPVAQRAGAAQTAIGAALAGTVGNSLTDNSGGSANTTIEALTTAVGSALTDNPTGTANNTLNDVGAAFSQSANNNTFADLAARCNPLRTDLLAAVAAGNNNSADLAARCNELRTDVNALLARANEERTLLNELRAALVALGAIKGSA